MAIDLAVPAFGHKNRVGIGRRHRLIRSWAAADAACHDGELLSALIDKDNTASDVWADTALSLQEANEKHLANNGLRSADPPARSQRASRCLGVPPEPMAASPRCARRSNTSLPGRRGRWAYHIRTIGLARNKEPRSRVGQSCLQHEADGLAHRAKTRTSLNKRAANRGAPDSTVDTTPRTSGLSSAVAQSDAPPIQGKKTRFLEVSSLLGKKRRWGNIFMRLPISKT